MKMLSLAMFDPGSVLSAKLYPGKFLRRLSTILGSSRLMLDSDITAIWALTSLITNLSLSSEHLNAPLPVLTWTMLTSSSRVFPFRVCCFLLSPSASFSSASEFGFGRILARATLWHIMTSSVCFNFLSFSVFFVVLLFLSFFLLFFLVLLFSFFILFIFFFIFFLSFSFFIFVFDFSDFLAFF